MKQDQMEQKNQKLSTSNIIEPNTQAFLRIPASTTILSSNFFDMTINLQKLTSVFRSIQDIIAQQNKTIQQLARDIRTVQASLNQKIQEQNRKNTMLFNKLDMRVGETSDTNYCCIMDVHKKAQNRDQELSKQIQRRFQLANSKIGKVQDSAIQDLRIGLINLKRQIIGGLQIQKQQGQPQDKKVDLNSLAQYFASQIRKVKQSIVPTFEQFYDFKQLQKKKKHTQNMLDLTYRKQQIDNPFLQFKEGGLQQSNSNRIVYSTTRRPINLDQKQRQYQKQNDKQKKFDDINYKIKTVHKARRHMSFNNYSGVQEQILSSIQQNLDKIQKIQQTINDQSQNLGFLKNKQVIMDEKINIMHRKLQKNCYETTQIKTNIRKVQSQKIDDRTIEQLRNYMKWAVRDLQQKINLKCSNEDLNKQKVKLVEKISILHENLVQKADKGQIQKALIFLENKIKQIILLIAAEQSQEKQGAIVKVAAKCLSCDKQLERQLKEQTNKCKRDIKTCNQGQYIKSISHRVRQRYKKQVAQTLGNQTFND